MAPKGLRLALALALSLSASAWAAGARVEAVRELAPVVPAPQLPALNLPALPTLPATVSQPALGTPGVYTAEFHKDYTNPRIKADIEAGRYLRLAVSEGRLTLKAAGPNVASELAARVGLRAQGLPAFDGHEGSEVILVEAEPGSPQASHPHLLAVTKSDYQLGHAGTNRDARGRPRGRFAYLTAGLFADESVPQGALTSLLAEELGHAKERSQALAQGRKPPVESFGERHAAALETLLSVVKSDLEHGRPEVAGPKLNAWERFTRWLKTPRQVPRIPWSFKLKNGDFFYHGTTLEDFLRIVDSGGVMKAEVSQFSMLANDSVGYAYTRRHNLGKADNPIILLQFPREAIAPLVSGEAFRPAAALIELGVPPNHQSYAIATSPVPLSLMTRQAKNSILAWLRVQAVRYPEQPQWREALQRVRKVLDP